MCPVVTETYDGDGETDFAADIFGGRTGERELWRRLWRGTEASGGPQGTLGTQ